MNEITVMTYNICHYCFDKRPNGFPADIMDEKVCNLKTMFMEYHPDMIGIQEEYEYIDKDHTQKAAPYLYKPVWSFRSGYKACSVRSKLPVVAGTYKLMQFSTGQYYRRGIFTVDGKKLLFISAHPWGKVGNSDKRKVEYTELFQHIRSSQWDYCIVTGDFNTTEKIDKENLKSLCEGNNFTMAIGQYLPWVVTYMGHDGTARQSFDNILVSDRITIKSTKVLREWYDHLYSDHVPVIADVLLR